MTIDMNKIKNHPGFMPFGCRNISNSDIADTQSEKDRISREKEVNHDEGLQDSNSNTGGEKGKA